MPCDFSSSVCETFAMQPIGYLETPFKQRFAVPRQPGLVADLPARLVVVPPYDCPQAWVGIEAYSHVWLLFVFDRSRSHAFQPTVRPPRLGGNRRIGVFASRSNFRPNPIGLSVVALERLEYDNHRVRLRVRGCDMLDATPVLDVKPYIPYADALRTAHAGLAPNPPTKRFTVVFSESAQRAILARQARYPELQTVLTELLAYDPRPAYTTGEEAPDQVFATAMYDFDLHWRIDGDVVEVLALHDVALGGTAPTEMQQALQK